MSTPEQDEPVPLGFKLVVAAAGIYLLMRAMQGVAWIVDRLL